MWNRRLKRQIPDGTRVGGCNRSYSGGWGCGGGVEIYLVNEDNCPLYNCPQHKTFVSMELQRKFGEVVKELRLEKNLSQESLAFQSGIDRTYIGDIEKGNRNISLQIIIQLSQAFQISLSDFFKKIETNGEIK